MSLALYHCELTIHACCFIAPCRLFSLDIPWSIVLELNGDILNELGTPSLCGSPRGTMLITSSILTAYLSGCEFPAACLSTSVIKSGSGYDASTTQPVSI
ncbi:hypothetical protein ABVK25_000646 [Lepraria finkii]|uniref:Uncharacterized protein n=1 Tax=Lepraria finkii TaxID=1340010 RepID=A0ABR4BNH7_9LECA